MGVHTYNSSTWEVEAGRSEVHVLLGYIASSRLVGFIRPYVGDKKEKSNFGSSKQLMLRAIFEPF